MDSGHHCWRRVSLHCMRPGFRPLVHAVASQRARLACCGFRLGFLSLAMCDVPLLACPLLLCALPTVGALAPLDFLLSPREASGHHRRRRASLHCMGPGFRPLVHAAASQRARLACYGFRLGSFPLPCAMFRCSPAPFRFDRWVKLLLSFPPCFRRQNR